MLKLTKAAVLELLHARIQTSGVHDFPAKKQPISVQLFPHTVMSFSNVKEVQQSILFHHFAESVL